MGLFQGIKRAASGLYEGIRGSRSGSHEGVSRGRGGQSHEGVRRAQGVAWGQRALSQHNPFSPTSNCEADKDCGPLEICHKGKCTWFDDVPLGAPVAGPQQGSMASIRGVRSSRPRRFLYADSPWWSR